MSRSRCDSLRDLFNPMVGPRFWQSVTLLAQNPVLNMDVCHELVLDYGRYSDDSVVVSPAVFNEANLANYYLSRPQLANLEDFDRLVDNVQTLFERLALWQAAFARVLTRLQCNAHHDLWSCRSFAHNYFVARRTDRPHTQQLVEFQTELGRVQCDELPRRNVDVDVATLALWLPKYLGTIDLLHDMLECLARHFAAPTADRQKCEEFHVNDGERCPEA